MYVADLEGNLEEALQKSAVLICQYGGIITIEEAAESEEVIEIEELEWIPTDVLQLTGDTEQEKNLSWRVEDLNSCISDPILKWNQSKIDYVWEGCKDYYENYGIQVDPRLLLAIIFQEGTGSFNTSSDNLVSDGGHGAESDFMKDCYKAIDLLGGKVIAYVQFHEVFSIAREEAYQKGYKGIKDYDDILHYLNWQTPRLSMISRTFFSGTYAGDSNWNRKVRQIYGEG